MLLLSHSTVFCKSALTHAPSLSDVRLSVTPWTIALQAPLFMGFSRQEYWSGLPFPPLGDLSDPGITPMLPVSLALQAIHTAEPRRSQLEYC